jgi:hypothetical protein
MDRDRLVSLLSGSHDAHAACRAALRDGAPFVVYGHPLPANNFLGTYRRRQRHTRETGIPTLGFDLAIEALAAADTLPLRLGSVTATDPPYHFQLFLREDMSAVVACLGVDQQHRELGGRAGHRYAVNVVSKFGADSYLERSWTLPPEVNALLREHVRMTPEGWVMDEWPVTTEIATAVQPWVDEPIDVSAGAWSIGSEQAAPSEPWSIGTEPTSP